ncbi:MAG: hypothetical protein FRX49_00592 [Trebouxia sp. A1-2]|nr:MAG: hypothetical protein FRX49_00592 [Trebouxia sp. A1-2]
MKQEEQLLMQHMVWEEEGWQGNDLAGVSQHSAGARFHNVEGFPGLPLAHYALPGIEDARLQRGAQHLAQGFKPPQAADIGQAAQMGLEVISFHAFMLRQYVQTCNPERKPVGRRLPDFVLQQGPLSEELTSIESEDGRRLCGIQDMVYLGQHSKHGHLADSPALVFTHLALVALLEEASRSGFVASKQCFA